MCKNSFKLDRIVFQITEFLSVDELKLDWGYLNLVENLKSMRINLNLSKIDRQNEILRLISQLYQDPKNEKLLKVGIHIEISQFSSDLLPLLLPPPVSQNYAPFLEFFLTHYFKPEIS